MTNENSNPNAPTPIDTEVTWDKSQTIVSKSDLFGTIDYANQAFANVSGYEEYELVGKPHSVIRHPDMPKIIYKILWDNLKIEKKFQIFLKNLAKSGQYYWVLSDFEYNKDSEGNVIEYVSRRRAVPTNVLENDIVPLYKKLFQIEQASGIKYSEKYLLGYLEEKGMNLEDYIFSLMGESNQIDFPVKNESAFNSQKLEEVQETKIEEETKIIEAEKTAQEIKVVEKVDTIEEVKAIEIVNVVEEVKTAEKTETAEDLKAVEVIIKTGNQPKSEIKNKVSETTDFSSSDYEEVQRETRSGFIGKLFNRE